MRKNVLLWILRIIPAIILLQTLFFKFTAAPESVHIFKQLGVEPFGRIGLGVVELVTAILLLVPKTSYYGALLGVLMMLGAVMSHLTILGVVVQDDGGALFLLAVVTLACCALLLGFERKFFRVKMR